MESLTDWKTGAERWLDTDLELLTTDAGWSPCRSGRAFGLVRRRTDDDENDLFRWRLALDAPADRVFDEFVHRILENHAHWTKEFAGGRVVETLGPEARLIHQRFEPGLPGIAPRDLCSLEVTRRLSDDAVLTSFRSVDAMPAEAGHVRIDWWGAALIRRLSAQTSELSYLDRENQGGRIPAFLMNLAMPKYLVDQAVAVQRFFARAR